MTFLGNLFKKNEVKDSFFPDPIAYPYWFQRKEELAQDKRKGGSVFVGDSITDNFRTLCPSFFNDSVRNFGICGDTTIGVAKRLDVLVNWAPEKVFLLIGTNNIGFRMVPGKAPDTYSLNTEKDITRVVSTLVGSYGNIIKAIQLNLPTCKIYVQSILPINNIVAFPKQDATVASLLKTRSNFDIASVNKILLGLSTMFSNVEYVDLYSSFLGLDGQCKPELVSDGIHPNEAGYEVWKSKVLNLIS